MNVQLCKRIEFHYQNFPLNSKFKIQNLVIFKDALEIFFNWWILITIYVDYPPIVVSTLVNFFTLTDSSNDMCIWALGL